MASLHHSSLQQSHWEDAVRDAAFKYNHIYHHSVGNVPITLWQHARPHVPQFLIFGQLGHTPQLGNKAQLSKLQSRAATVRYLYATDAKHIVVLELSTNSCRRIRTVDFEPYYRETDPLAHNTNAFKTFAPHRTPSQITATTPAPCHHGQARNYPDAALWARAHNDELDALDRKKAIQWLPDHCIPKTAKLIPLTLGYWYKRDPQGTIVKRKARCAARGDKMIPNVHFDPEHTTMYMADRTTVRLLFAIAASQKLHIEHIDIEAAYLHEPFAHNGRETVYVSQPPRFDGSFKHPHKAGKLDKNLYGTPSAGHTYLNGIFRLLRHHEFTQSEADPCLFHRRRAGETLLVSVSVDDFTIVANLKSLLTAFATLLSEAYNIKRLGEHTTFLGWTVRRTTSGDIHVS